MSFPLLWIHLSHQPTPHLTPGQGVWAPGPGRLWDEAALMDTDSVWPTLLGFLPRQRRGEGSPAPYGYSMPPPQSLQKVTARNPMGTGNSFGTP